MTCASCGGKGWGWMKDVRLPWVAECGYDEKTDMHWDALACLSCAPCATCQPEDHAKWQVFYKKSLAAWRASEGQGGKVHLTDEQRLVFQRELEKLGVAGYVLDQPPKEKN